MMALAFHGLLNFGYVEVSLRGVQTTILSAAPPITGLIGGGMVFGKVRYHRVRMCTVFPCEIRKAINIY